jgi:hypothetical protein
VWLNFAPAKVLVLWQVSQFNWVCTWLEAFTTFARASNKPLVWQLAQSFGVPLNTPLTWQDSQRALVCTPVRAKPV